jgi:O-antigen ligase
MADSDLEKVCAAWVRFVVVLVGIAVVVVVLIAVNWPQPFDAVYERLVFPDPVPA